MICVSFAKMDQVFSKENKTLKKYWKIGKNYWKSQGKVREFCQSGKVGTLYENLNPTLCSVKSSAYYNVAIWFVVRNGSGIGIRNRQNK